MIPFEPFNQDPPRLGNQYAEDPLLRSLVARAFPPDARRAIEPELEALGALSAGELFELQAADRLNEPVLTTFDPWGKRIDHIELTPLWKRAERIAAEYGVVAAAYEPRFGPLARNHQMALAYLFAPSTDIYTCPLAMTDGAAATLRRAGNARLSERALPHLLSRDPATFWTSGQWMTESTGGSDVGLSETVARKGPDGAWRLYGRKWFTSATTSPMALTLARPEGNGPGGHGLALFYVEVRDASGALDHIEIARLKDKLGTRKVPTAELFLHGTRGELVLGPTDGVRNITPMLNVTRTWNAICSASAMRRSLALARDYARRRVAFGAPLSEKPLHLETLAALEVEFQAALTFVWFAGGLLGREAAGEVSDADRRLLRIVTPLLKLMTAKQAVAVTSEVLECFGGAGYVEDTGLPVLLRDAQVLPIWEGTTNVLSLDALRAMAKDDALAALLAHVERVTLVDAELQRRAEAARAQLRATAAWIAEHRADGPQVEANARRIAMTLARGLAAVLLAEHADWCLSHGAGGLTRDAALRFEVLPDGGAPRKTDLTVTRRLALAEQA